MRDTSLGNSNEFSTDDLIGVVQELKVIHQRSGISSVAAVGELILERFFGGSIATFQSADRHKDRSLRRLARCDGCPYSKSALHQAVRIHLVRLTTPIVQTYEHIGPSHIAVTLALTDVERESLLGVAETQQWSVRRLRQEVERVQNSHVFPLGNRRGRPRQAQAERALSVVRQSSELIDAALQGTLALPLGPTERTQLRRALSELEARCGAFIDQLDWPAKATVAPPLDSSIELVPPSRGGPRSTNRQVANGTWITTRN